MDDLSGACYLLTGAAGGIGSATAEMLRGAGARVLAADLAPVPGDPDSFGVDLTTPEGNEAAVATAVERFGRLDGVIANAGVQHVAAIEDFPTEEWDRLLALMLSSPFHLARQAWPSLKQSSRARFVVVASAHALVASPYKSAYVAAKHGVLGLTKTLALEGAEDGILATAICPGYVRTPMVENQIAEQALATGLPEERVLSEVMLASHAVKKMIEPSEIANVIGFLLGPGGAAFTGSPVVIDQGWTAR
jgi:3-hydroxybutyrate dehydrogenase